ncbi:MAG: AMP-binding protein, partial [Firmicutes bacterium]|nr:AMP-binding protein [Bacillota bacterium]
MKLCFSTKNVKSDSFAACCRTAYEYGFSGFEVFDPLTDRASFEDSIFRSENTSDGRRKLRNRGLEIPALRCPYPLNSEEISADTLVSLVELARRTGTRYVLLRLENSAEPESLKEKLAPAIDLAVRAKTGILLETSGPLAVTSRLVGIIKYFGTSVLGAAWNIRETFFSAKETPEETIQSLGAYIRYVRLGDRLDGKDVLIGEGGLPVDEFIEALESLNYEGFVCCAWNSETSDADIVLTHFAGFMARRSGGPSERELQYNRSRTGTFPWKKYEILDMTFPRLLDALAEIYPDQYAFKYTTLEYTRTYAQFREDVDAMAAGLIALGVEPGSHVAIWATNVPAWFITFWAATRIGAVLVTVNSEYRSHEIEYLLRQSDTHTLVMIEGYKGISYREIIEELCPELKDLKEGEALYSASLPFLRNVVTCGFETKGGVSWDAMLERGRAVPGEEVRRRASMVRPSDVCNMQ